MSLSVVVTKERQGELFIFAEEALWGLFPVITILSLNKLSPLVSLIGSTFFAAIFFALLLTIRKRWSEIKITSVYKDIILATFFIGIIYFSLTFLALKFTSAGNASIIGLTQIFFSYIFFHVFRKDPFPVPHLFGAILMVIGALVVLYPNIHGFRSGDFLLLIAASIAPFGNFFTQRARKKVSSETIMFLRSVLTTIIIFLIIVIFKINFSFTNFRSSLVFLLINGIFLLGLSKIFWIEAIHRISIVKGNALGSISPLFTLFYAWIFLKDIPTMWQLLSLIPMAFGVILLGRSSLTKKS